jgi:hypothetical protein
MDIWASKTEWRRRGYALRGGDDTPFISRTHVTAGSGWVTYNAYHAFHVRPLPKVWSQLVTLLPPTWHHLRGQEPDRATVCVVHGLLLGHGLDEHAARLRWAVLGTEERFRADLAAHEATVREEEEKGRAREEARKRWKPTTRRRRARYLARWAAEQTARGIEEELCRIPVGLDWQDRPTLLAYLRENGKAGVAEQLTGVTGEELRVRPCFGRKNRQKLCRVLRAYRGLSAEEWKRIATSKRPIPDDVVELLVGAAR